VTRLRSLDAPLCRAVLRHWVTGRGFAVPDTRHLGRIVDEVLGARPDAVPLVAWPRCEVRRYRDDLFALAPLPPVPPGMDLPWLAAGLTLPAGFGSLELRDGDGRALAPERLGLGLIRVRFALPGLACRPAGGRHHRPLKHLYQEAGVPPWLRRHIPLIFAEDRLVAVGHLWVCPPDGSGGARTFQVAWTGHPWEGAGLLTAPAGARKMPS
jgi:tRNA(Ile)-lysidine synthase